MSLLNIIEKFLSWFTLEARCYVIAIVDLVSESVLSFLFWQELDRIRTSAQETETKIRHHMSLHLSEQDEINEIYDTATNPRDNDPAYRFYFMLICSGMCLMILLALKMVNIEYKREFVEK